MTELWKMGPGTCGEEISTVWCLGVSPGRAGEDGVPLQRLHRERLRRPRQKPLQPVQHLLLHPGKAPSEPNTTLQEKYQSSSIFAYHVGYWGIIKS